MNHVMTGSDCRSCSDFQGWFSHREAGALDAPSWLAAGSTRRGETWDGFIGHAWAGISLVMRDFME